MAGFLKLSSNLSFLLFILVVCDKQNRYMKHVDLSHLWNGETEIYVGRETSTVKIASTTPSRTSCRKSQPLQSSLKCLRVITLSQKLAIVNILLLCNDISLNPGPAGQCKCVLLNARSLKAFYTDAYGTRQCKLIAFKNLIYDNSYDVVAVTETWLNNTITDSEISEQGYHIYRRDRQNRIGGGVLLLIKNNLISTHRQDLETDLELLCVELKLSGSPKLLISVVYRPPDSDLQFTNKFSTFLQNTASIQRSKHLILGDFNFPKIEWVDNIGFSNYEHEFAFCECLKENSLFQINNFSTYLTHKNNAHILDLIITNDPIIASNIEAHSHQSINFPSDHFVLDFQLNAFLRRYKIPQRLVFNFKNVDFQSLCSKISESDPFNSIIPEDLDIDSAWLCWKMSLLDIIKNNVPMTKARNSATPPWIDGEVKHLLNKKETARRKANITQSPFYKEKYINLRRASKKLVETKHRDYIKSLTMEIHDNPKRFWGYFHTKSKSNTIPASVTHNGEKYTTPQEKCDTFNTFFHSTFTPDHEDPSNITPLTLGTLHLTELSSLNEIYLTEEEVCNILQKLDIRKAMGPDNIPTVVLKKCAKSLSKSLCQLFNSSLSTGQLPSEWKKSVIIPVHKKGNKEQVENYRPISLLCIISKVLERCVFNHTIKHISEMLNVNQHGFLKGRSTVTQLLAYIHKIGQSLDKGYQSDVIYLDFSKAFDSVSHPRLVLKLRQHGISGMLLNWFRNYLLNRVHCTVLQGATSPLLPVLSGVPQGSILGPLLFLVYINDLPSVINNETSIGLFADDSKCFKTIHNVGDCIALQNDLDSMSTWSNIWKLRFNPTKCEVLSITRKRNPLIYNYNLDSHILTHTTTQKDLGVIVTKDLKWNAHIKQTVAKGYRMLGFLRRHTNKHFDSESKKKLYNALIRPYLGYASQVWSPLSIGNMKKVESLQRRSTKYILPNSNLSYRDRLLKLNLLPVSFWHEILDLMFYYKCTKNLYNFPINDFCNAKKTTRVTRNSNPLDLSVPLCKTKLFQASYFNRLPKLWNALPTHIRTATSKDLFKLALHKHYKMALTNSFSPDNPLSWRSICPKCSTPRDILVPPKCCY